MRLDKIETEIIIRTIFWAMWPMKSPIYLSKVLWNSYISIFRNYIDYHKNNLVLNNHELYILLEWIIEVKENISILDYFDVTWFQISELERLISKINKYIQEEWIIFNRIKK